MSEPESTAPDRGPEDLPGSLRLAVEAVNELKCHSLLLLDVRGVASFTDYMLLCNGRGERHVQAIVDAVVDKLTENKDKPLHKEGYEQAGWVLVDFVDFLVNVFTPEMRDFYQLERVWRDAPALLGERPEPDSGAAREKGGADDEASPDAEPAPTTAEAGADD